MIEYVWLWLADDEAQASRISRAVELGDRAEALIETIFPPVIAFCFGVLPNSPVDKAARLQLGEDLKAEFGENAKLYHGSGRAAVGNVGSSTRFTFITLLPNRSKLLTDLCAMEFGAYRERPAANA